MGIWNHVHIQSIGFEMFFNPNLVNDSCIFCSKSLAAYILRHNSWHCMGWCQKLHETSYILVLKMLGFIGCGS